MASCGRDGPAVKGRRIAFRRDRMYDSSFGENTYSVTRSAHVTVADESSSRSLQGKVTEPPLVCYAMTEQRKASPWGSGPAHRLGLESERD